MKVTQLEQLYRDGMSRLKEQKKRQEQGRLEQTVKRLSQEQKALYNGDAATEHYRKAAHGPRS